MTFSMVFAPLGIGRLSLYAAAEEIGSIASAAKALTDSKPSTAALKALRHPNPESFGSLLTGVERVFLCASDLDLQHLRRQDQLRARSTTTSTSTPAGKSVRPTLPDLAYFIRFMARGCKGL
jgi:hypothetical protein